jgi:hypothetical protein
MTLDFCVHIHVPLFTMCFIYCALLFIYFVFLKSLYLFRVGVCGDGGGGVGGGRVRLLPVVIKLLWCALRFLC